MIKLNANTLLCTEDTMTSIMLSNDPNDLMYIHLKRCSSVDGVKWYMLKFM